MRIAHFDCFSGISGDMTLGAMVDAGLSITFLRDELKKLGVDGYSISAKKVLRLGFGATKVTVRLKRIRNKKARLYPDIIKLIAKSALKPKVKKMAIDMFTAIAEAEAVVHSSSIEKVHFHEVGAIDSIVDIVGASIGFVKLKIDRITAGAVNIGAGMVKTDHGVLPTPAPATALLLCGVPTISQGPAKELTTPTGAAILKTSVRSFGAQPPMIYETVGVGAGGYQFEEWPNILRIFIGQRDDSVIEERLIELATNIDDMNPQCYQPVIDALFKAGALDVTITPVQMKKGRPGATLSVLCGQDKTDALKNILFRKTTTLGLRSCYVDRFSLAREIKKVKTKFGVIQIKVARLPGGGIKIAPEFESVNKAALAHNVPFDTVYHSVTNMKGDDYER